MRDARRGALHSQFDEIDTKWLFSIVYFKVTFLHCVFSNVPSNCLNKRMYSSTVMVYLAFLHCGGCKGGCTAQSVWGDWYKVMQTGFKVQQSYTFCSDHLSRTGKRFFFSTSWNKSKWEFSGSISWMKFCTIAGLILQQVKVKVKWGFYARVQMY